MNKEFERQEKCEEASSMYIYLIGLRQVKSQSLSQIASAVFVNTSYLNIK
jgi:hypothetical protein